MALRADFQVSTSRRWGLTVWLAAAPKNRPLFVKQRLTV
jgi:hypothetical protein